MKKIISIASMVLAAAAPEAGAQGYPNKPVHLIISFSPGSSTDIVGRVVAQKLAESTLLKSEWPDLTWGPRALVAIATAPEVDVVISAIVGVTGLECLVDREFMSGPPIGGERLLVGHGAFLGCDHVHCETAVLVPGSTIACGMRRIRSDWASA